MFFGPIEHCVNLTECLLNSPLLIFHKCDTNISLAVGPKSGSGGKGDVRFFQQPEAEIEGTGRQLFVGLLTPNSARCRSATFAQTNMLALGVSTSQPIFRRPLTNRSRRFS